MPLTRFNKNDILVMKKNHPCGSNTFRVAMCGSDVKLICTSCQRTFVAPRERIEKMIARVIYSTSTEET